ncbi:hypothetical protein O1L55_41330 [Streptomyces albulus]|nr:hypothetical protein [Streptomyces noursei]
MAMGLINALGNLGGFAGPYLVGWLTDATGSSLTGFAVLAGFLAVAVVLATLGLRPGPARPGDGSQGTPVPAANPTSGSGS